jgi:2-methylisocitrate lyase-like PEP mutase family enzyme
MNKYEIFYQLHHQNKPLVLPNAWNVKSAQLIEQSGFSAIATSSGAISNSLGYEDGEKIPFKELLYLLQRIKASTKIPLTVDFEKGYSDDINKMLDNMQQLADIGVSGINLEDSQGEQIYLKKLSAIKNRLEKNNQKLFINARTDGFLQKVDQPVETTIRRAQAYKEAGADGLFVTGISDIPTIQAISSAIALPLNVVGSPKLSSIAELSKAGVSRISMAAFLYRAAYTRLEAILKEIEDGQSFEPLY